MGSVARQIRAVAEAYHAFGRGDLDGVLSRMAHDVVWDARGALWERGLYTGHIGVRAYFARLEQMWDRLRLADYDIEPTGPRTFVVTGRLRGYVQGRVEDARFTHQIELTPEHRIARLEIVVERDGPET